MINYKIILLFLLSIFISCASKRITCNENPVFKEKFFKSIKNVEDAINSKNGGTRKEYDEALAFLDKYVHVDYEKTLNYRNIYTCQGFSEDKEVWLKWYEDNKCQNIQIK